MTQKQIEEIKKKRDYLYLEFDMEYRKKKDELQKELNKLEDKCDHKWPNGKSAIVGSMFCNSCEICNWADM